METAYLIAAFAFVVTALIHGLLALSVWQKSTRCEVDWTFFFSMLASAFWCVGNAVASAFGTPLEKSPSALGQALSVASYFVLYTIAPIIRHCVVLSQLSMKGWRRWASLALNYLGVIPFALLFGYNVSPLFLVYITLIIIEVRRTGGLRSRYAQGSGLRPIMRVGLGGTLLLVALPPVLCPFYPDKADLICLIPKFGSLPPALVLAYVVLRYRFMDIVLKRSLLYSLVSGLLLGLYLLGVRYGAEALFPAGGPHTVALDLFLILVLIFAFQPLKAGLQKGIDRLFFCSCRDLKSAEVQKNFSQAFTHWSDLEALCRSFAEKVTKSLGVTYGTILFSDETLHGFTPSPQPSAFRGEDGDAIRAVCRVLVQDDSQLIVVEELAEGPLKAACREVGVGLVVTLACREQPGWLLLGEKRSGGPFLSEETFLVEAVCGQVAVAIDNFCLVQAKVALEREVQHREKLVAIGQLAATIAHEIRNPITGAKCLLQQIEENLNGAPEGKEYVQLALEDLERVEQSVSQLLTFARKEEFHFSEQPVLQPPVSLSRSP